MATLGLVGSFAAIGAAPASASGPNPNLLAFQKINSNQCLAVAAGSTSGGAGIIQWTCDDLAEQAWQWQNNQVKYAHGFAYEPLRNWNSGMCLADPGSSDGNAVQLIQYGCDGQDEQLWAGVQTGSGYAYMNLASGKCLAVGAGSTTPGAAVIQYDCDAGPEQTWVASPTL